MNPADAKCGVWRVRVRGLQKTHESVVRQELASAGVERAETLGDIHGACVMAASALRSLGIFDAADLVLDTAPASAKQAAGQPLADITCTVVEKKNLYSATTTIATQAGENSMEGKVSARNVLGRAEQFDMQMEVGQQKSSAFRLSAIRPRWMGSDAMLSADLSKQAVSHLKHSSFMEKLLSGGATAKVGNAAEAGGSHEVGYKLELRDVCRLPVNSTASWPVVQQRGTSLKSAITHTYSRSTLDDVLMPTCGAMLRLATEIAGIAPVPLGDAKFCKHTLTSSVFVPVLPEVASPIACCLDRMGLNLNHHQSTTQPRPWADS